MRRLLRRVGEYKWRNLRDRRISASEVYNTQQGTGGGLMAGGG